MSVYGRVVPKGPNLESTQTSVRVAANAETAVRPSRGIVFSNQKERSAETQYDMDKLQTSRSVKEASHKRPQTARLLLQKMSRIGKSVEIKGRFVRAEGGGGELAGSSFCPFSIGMGASGSAKRWTGQVKMSV